jgi:hypothetical protein
MGSAAMLMPSGAGSDMSRVTGVGADAMRVFLDQPKSQQPPICFRWGGGGRRRRNDEGRDAEEKGGRESDAWLRAGLRADGRRRSRAATKAHKAKPAPLYPLPPLRLSERTKENAIPFQQIVFSLGLADCNTKKRHRGSASLQRSSTDQQPGSPENRKVGCRMKIRTDSIRFHCSSLPVPASRVNKTRVGW